MLIQQPPVAITDNLMMLGLSQYPLFLVMGESEGAIFEGGVGATGPVVGRQVADMGLDGDFVKQIVVTHGHPDHVMAISALRVLFPSSTVSASKAAAGVMSAEKAIGFFANVDQVFTGALIESGAVTEEERPEPFVDTQIPVDRILAEGDTIDVAPMKFNVLETPGHSDCSLSFHDADAGVLICSDATGYFIAEPAYWWPNYFTSYGDNLDSMRRLAALEAEILCLSHNAVITGADAVADYFRDAIAATEAYHARIIAEYKSGASVRDIAGQLGVEAFERIGLLPVDFFQKNCSLLAKLSLKHEGVE